MTPLDLADLRAAAAAALILYLPGLSIGRRIARASASPTAVWAFPSSVALLLTGLFLAQLLRLDLRQAGWILSTLAIGGSLFSLWELSQNFRTFRRREPATFAFEEERRVRPVEWILIALTMVFLASVGGPLGLRFDSLDHLGAIRRSLLSNTILPLDQFYRGGDGQGWDPRKGFFPALLAWVCGWSHTDPCQLWHFLPVVLAPAVLLALAGLMRGWLGVGWRSDLSLTLWILVGAGSGLLWLSRTGYPNRPAYALGFLALGLYLSSLRAGSTRGRLFGLGLLVYTAELIHLVPGLVVGMGLGLGMLAALLSGAERVRALRVTLLSAAAAGAGIAPPLIFRWFYQGPLISTCHTHPQGLLSLGRGLLTASPLFILFYAGWVVLVALLLVPLAAGRAAPSLRRPLLALTLGPWVLAGTPLFTLVRLVLGYLGVRFLDVVPAVPVLTLALEEAWVRWRRPSPPRTKVIPILALLLLIGFLGSAVVTFPSMWKSAAQGRTGPDSALRFQRLLDAIPRKNQDGAVPVVLADVFTSYAVTGFTGGYVISTLDQHGSPTDGRWRFRLDDQRDMLYGGRGDAVADSLLRFYGVDYVVVNSALPVPSSQFGAQVTEKMLRLSTERLAGDPERFVPIYQGTEGSVYRVEKTLPGGWSAARPALGEGDGAGSPSQIAVDFGAIEARGLGLPAGPTILGRQQKVILQWVRRGTIATDLPLWLHFRCIGPQPKRWYIRSTWGRPGRLLAQYFAHQFYSFRIAVMPLDGIRDLRSLPLGVPVADTLSVYIPWKAVPGRYSVQLRLVEETYLPNLDMYDLFHDDSRADAPVVGWLDLMKESTPPQGAK